MKQMLLGLTLLVIMTNSLQAALIYGFRFSPTTTPVLPGPQSIDIFLDQTATDTDIANLHTLGLGTANFTVNSSNPLVTFSGGSTGFVDGAEGGLVGATLDVSALSSAVFAQQSLVNPGTIASGTRASIGDNSFSTIRIGTVTFNLAAGESTTLTTADFSAGDFDLADLTSIGAISAAASLTITAVPEPSSLALLGFVGCGAALLRRRK